MHYSVGVWALARAQGAQVETLPGQENLKQSPGQGLLFSHICPSEIDFLLSFWLVAGMFRLNRAWLAVFPSAQGFFFYKAG